MSISEQLEKTNCWKFYQSERKIWTKHQRLIKTNREVGTTARTNSEVIFKLGSFCIVIKIEKSRDPCNKQGGNLSKEDFKKSMRKFVSFFQENRKYRFRLFVAVYSFSRENNSSRGNVNVEFPEEQFLFHVLFLVSLICSLLSLILFLSSLPPVRGFHFCSLFPTKLTSTIR